VIEIQFADPLGIGLEGDNQSNVAPIEIGQKAAYLNSITNFETMIHLAPLFKNLFADKLGAKLSSVTVSLLRVGVIIRIILIHRPWGDDQILW